MLQLARTRIPFGKYAGTLLLDLPEPYLVWLRQAGGLEGELGEMLLCMYEVKLNGLEYLLDPLRPKA